MIRRKAKRGGLLSTSIKRQEKSLLVSELVAMEFYQKKGWVVLRPSWPDFLLWNEKEDKILLVEVKSVGDRLSHHQALTFRAFKELGFDLEIAIVTERADIIQIPFDENDHRLRIPQRVFFLNSKFVPKKKRLLQRFEPWEPFDPAKHSEEIKQGAKEFDKEAEKHFQEETDWMKPLLKYTEAGKEKEKLIDKMEASPEEAPPQKRYIRDVTEDDEKVKGKG